MEKNGNKVLLQRQLGAQNSAGIVQTREEGAFVIMPGLGREVQRGTVVEPAILTTHDFFLPPMNA